MSRFLEYLRECGTRWFGLASARLIAERPAIVQAALPLPTKSLRPLERVVLNDEVAQTLFDDFERHRQTARGNEEIGWVLMGGRVEAEAVVMAALPAGTERNASLTHVRFNSEAQAVASRMLRQHDKRLGILGVVHTHPGSLRHPSGGDFRGDSLWVQHLRGREGVFGIGTADGAASGVNIATLVPHQQTRGELCFTWYTLAHGASRYQKIPVTLKSGPDYARPLQKIWPLLEKHCRPLENLARQQHSLRFEVLEDDAQATLAVSMPLAGPGQTLRLLLREGQVRYYVESGGSLMAVTPEAEAVDLGVYLILAELARRG